MVLVREIPLLKGRGRHDALSHAFHLRLWIHLSFPIARATGTDCFEGAEGNVATGNCGDIAAEEAADDSTTWAVEDGDTELDVEVVVLPKELGAGTRVVYVGVTEVVVGVVEDKLLVVAAPRTPIVVRAEGVPASLVNALSSLPGNGISIP